MYWIDDVNSKYYNKMVEVVSDRVYTNNNLPYLQVQNRYVDWKTSEHLTDYPLQYSYAIEIKYNEKCEKGKGSAIFLHVSTESPTAGCIAIPEKDIILILKNIKKNTKIYIK